LNILKNISQKNQAAESPKSEKIEKSGRPENLT
jgi:hypothetical protein